MGRKKPWSSMSEEDIERIAKKCRRCSFRAGNYGEGNCNYVIITGHTRGCRPDECDKFTPGKRINPKKQALG